MNNLYNIMEHLVTRLLWTIWILDGFCIFFSRNHCRATWDGRIDIARCCVLRSDWHQSRHVWRIRRRSCQRYPLQAEDWNGPQGGEVSQVEESHFQVSRLGISASREKMFRITPTGYSIHKSHEKTFFFTPTWDRWDLTNGHVIIMILSAI